jgi:glucokinase
MITCLAGIDAGGTKLAAGLVDVRAGTVLRRCQRPSEPARGGAAILADCVALAREASAGQAAGVGLGVPELVSAGGQITSAANWDWRGRDLAAAFAGVPVHVESDVRAAALAEARFGAGRGQPSFIYLSIGTGVSHALVAGGEPWRGARGNAIVVGAPLVELSASGAALAARAGRARAEEVLASAADADLVEEVAAVLAGELARLVNALDPAAVIIGGGLGLNPEFRQCLTALARRDIYAPDTRELDILPAGLGADAGIIGAALAAAGVLGEPCPAGRPAVPPAGWVSSRG